jgi:hypothetical protein
MSLVRAWCDRTPAQVAPSSLGQLAGGVSRRSDEFECAAGAQLPAQAEKRSRAGLRRCEYGSDGRHRTACGRAP